MQPYFFPYLGHFALIAHCDRWIVFDITQYTPKSYMSRNEILKATGGRQKILVELANSSIHIKTNAAMVKNSQATYQSLLGSLTHYKKHAPFYSQVVEVIHNTFISFARKNKSNLVNLNMASLESVCQYLGINFHKEVASEINLVEPSKSGPGSWAPCIAAQLGADEYINPEGGRSLFNIKDFAERDVRLGFFFCKEMEYETPGFQFFPNLSIIDVMMWNEPLKIREHIFNASRIEFAA